MDLLSIFRNLILGYKVSAIFHMDIEGGSPPPSGMVPHILTQSSELRLHDIKPGVGGGGGGGAVPALR